MTAQDVRKSIFDTVRTMLRRGFRQSEVEALDRVIDELENCTQDRVPSVPSVQDPRAKPGSIGPAGIALIKRFEGCARLRRDGLVEAYPDPGTGGEPWTIGWGATGPDHFHGGRIGPGTVWTQEQCDARFERDLARYAAEVAQAVGEAPTSQSQFDALTSFHYNTGAIFRATLTRKHIAGDHAGAAEEFHRWNKAGGRVLKGLVRRRREEAILYLQG
ncbi:lysozyme [Altererythrobacter arenosus]|uniref:Lysozyme n=1 Tax=Altererythrobacter arenosus TaxID=3032592 RepID=A0ABY8FVA5_9SPHN|nr:lysozyme [Altererythrobacter sp. CAU 1644]WFL78020.1 lysozyme [Altererythrobacter sp. CAU 1644]